MKVLVVGAGFAGCIMAMRRADLIRLIPVQIGNGVVVMHTPEEWRRFAKGVDFEAARAATAPLTEEDED
jgi:hypothetical protein